LDRHNALVGAGKAVRRLLDGAFLDVAHDDIRARLRQCRRDAQPDAGRGAGDDRGLAGNIHHRQYPPLQ
jgi:hypothetical protein